MRFRLGCWQLALALGLSVFGVIDAARAEQQPSRIVVTGEGEVDVAPDIAQIRSGVTTRGKTVLEATEVNSKLMAAILTASTNPGSRRRTCRPANYRSSLCTARWSGFRRYSRRAFVPCRAGSETCSTA